MQISWIDAIVVKTTLTSIQNALEYSNTPTEIILLLNEQTFIDKPLVGTPSDMWKHFIDHPLISKCKIDKVTNDDKFWGNANFRRDYITKNGCTYWGEADCYLPLEFFYISEQFQKSYGKKPYVLSFAVRKMWEGGFWEPIEHPLVQNKKLKDFDLTIKEQALLRSDTTITLQELYDFNSNQGDPEIVKLNMPKIEGTLTILSSEIPEKIICPDIDFFHEDFSLELGMMHLDIPQYHVKNILKGHNTVHPDKRANIFNKNNRDDNLLALQMKNKCREQAVTYASTLSNKFKL